MYLREIVMMMMMMIIISFAVGRAVSCCQPERSISAFLTIFVMRNCPRNAVGPLSVRRMQLCLHHAFSFMPFMFANLAVILLTLGIQLKINRKGIVKLLNMS
jgi:hypothetical protein